MSSEEYDLLMVGVLMILVVGLYVMACIGLDAMDRRDDGSA